MTRKTESSRLQKEIDANLKRVFDDVLNEEVPDRFKDLLAQLDAGKFKGPAAGDKDDT